MRKHKRFKKILLVMVLIGALLGVQVMEIVAYAAEEGGTAEPVEVCSFFSQLYQAVNNAKDGDVIGIDSVIDIQGDAWGLGCDDKHVTIVRMNDSVSFQVSTNSQFIFKNLTIDGNNIASNASIVEVYGSGANFENVTFQNCICKYASGAVMTFGRNNTFTNCTFKDNSGGTGGHICISNDAKVTISECTFTGGSATNGGAIYRTASNNPGMWVTISQSKIQGNTANESGGGIYTETAVVFEDSIIYGNTASLGEDIADTPSASVSLTNDLETLQQIYAGEDITVKGLIITSDESAWKRYVKVDYEEIVKEPEQPTEPSVPDDGDDSDQEEPTTPDNGEDTTDPSQPDDSDQDAGETPSDPTTPDDSEDTSTPTDPGDSETPSDTSNPGETPGDDSGSSGDNITIDTDNSSNDTTNTDNSEHSSKEDNSVTNTNSGNTTNSSSDHSQRTEDNSSVTYNYYYPSDSGAKDQEQQQPQQIVIHNYIQDDSESKETVKSDPMGNISVDAEGVDVSFEVKDGVYSISIKAQDPEPQVQQASEEPASETSMVNWYEIIKIGLLGAIVFVVKKK